MPMSKNYRVVSMPIWKVWLLGVLNSILWTFLIWLFNLIPSLYLTGIPRSLSIGDILLGSVWLVMVFSARWKDKHPRWYNWMSSVFIGLYITLLLLAGGITYWNALLDAPWNVIVNTVATILFVLMWILPALSFPLARRIATAQRRLDLILLRLGGPAAVMIAAGILGANFGMRGSLDGKMLFLAFMFPVLSIGLAQHFATALWGSRPWAKEEE